jgi:uncharacterized protein with HEPN domain
MQNMIQFCEKVLEYTDGLSQDGFIGNGLVFDATLRNLELIGGSATHIPGTLRAARSEIPWRLIVATRNQLIHAYLGIDNETVWSIIQDDIPELLVALREILEDSH